MPKLYFLICNVLSGSPFIKDVNEIEEIEWLTFNQFFDKYNDDQIGHGLIFLRQTPSAWKKYSD